MGIGEKARRPLAGSKRALLALALVVASVLAGWAWAQHDWSSFEQAEAEGWSVYPAIRDGIAAYLESRDHSDVGDDATRRWISSVNVLLGLLAELFSETEYAYGDEASICAYLAGTGGRLQVDGGGGRLQVDGGGAVLGARTYTEHTPWFPYRVMREPFADSWLSHLDSDHVIVIDSFNLKDLEDSLASFIGIGAVETDPRSWQQLIVHAVLEPGGQLVDDGGIDGWLVPHGHVVLYHLIALGAPAGSTIHRVWKPTEHDEIVVLEINRPAGASPLTIALVHIDYDDVTTIRKAMNYAAQEDQSKAVVVTSWGLTDCAIRSGLLDAKDVTGSLGDYLLAKFAGDAHLSDQDFLTQLCDAFRDFVSMDIDCTTALTVAVALAEVEQRAAAAVDWPLDETNLDLQQNVPYERVFASAGNQAMPFPMPPAAWPGVYGVASCQGPNQYAPLSWFSNVGDFLPQEHLVAPGAWFAVPGLPVGDYLGYWGTSFAAPHAALEVGLGGVWNPGEPTSLSYCAPITPP